MSDSNDITYPNYPSIRDFPNYFAREDGVILSIAHFRPWMNPSRKFKAIKSRPNSCGYPWVSLWRDGKSHTKTLHRLILEAFHGPCPPGMEGCHKDHNRANCSLDNLYWGTHAQNMRDMVEAGRQSRGERHAKAKIKDTDVLTIRKLYFDGEPIDDLAVIFSLSRQGIEGIVSGRNWKHLGGIPESEAARREIVMSHSLNLKREKKSQCILSVEDALYIRQARAAGVRGKDLAEQFGVSPQEICHIYKGRRWTKNMEPAQGDSTH